MPFEVVVICLSILIFDRPVVTAFQVVERHHQVAGRRQRLRWMASYKSGPAGQKWVFDPPRRSRVAASLNIFNHASGRECSSDVCQIHVTINSAFRHKMFQGTQ
jgi:hypothetical protein